MSKYQRAKWIWSPDWTPSDKEEPRILFFRKTFSLEAEPVKASLSISADTKYKLYINGTFAEIGPARGDREVWFLDTVDILPFLKKGPNVIAVSVLRYPQDPDKGNHGMFRTHIPGLFAQGLVQYNDRERISLVTDNTWKCKKDDHIRFQREEPGFSPLFIHEAASGSKETFGWKSAGYDDSSWARALPYPEGQVSGAVSPGNLLPRTVPFMYRKERFFTALSDLKKSSHSAEDWKDFLSLQKPLLIPANSEEIVEIHAGEEMTGYIHTGFTQGKGSRISLLYAEAYVQDETTGPNRIPVKNDRTDKAAGHLEGYEDCYVLSGLGTRETPEVYEPFWFRTFRFIRLHIQTGSDPLVLLDLHYTETGYPLAVQTRVTVPDPSLEDIWEISLRTLRRCMHESYEDCPFYEQLQYIMDTRQQILYTYALSSDDRLARKCIEDMGRSQRYDGLLNASYPNCNPNVIPGFSIYYILILYDHMMYYGDRELIRRQMPRVEMILEFFRSHLTPEGYVGKVGGVNGKAVFWSFIDWASDWSETEGMPAAGLSGPITMESLLYIYGLQHGAKLAEFLGRPEQAADFLAQAREVQKALLTHCIGKNGMLTDGPGIELYSQHCQVFGVLTGTLDRKTGHDSLLKTLLDRSYTQCTVAMNFYLFRALEMIGLYEYTDQYWDIWRKMLKNNCTTCVEAEAYARSECHGWGALALYELPCTILGVRPAAPGFGKVRISPVPGYLTSASGEVKTPRGIVKVSWEKKEEGLCLDYSLPEGMEAETGPSANDSHYLLTTL